MNLLALTQNESITWGDLILILVVIVLLGMALFFWRRR